MSRRMVTRLVQDGVFCDLCGMVGESDGLSRFLPNYEHEVNIVTMRYEYGDDYRIVEDFDVCQTCWKDRVSPWMHSQRTALPDPAPDSGTPQTPA